MMRLRLLVAIFSTLLVMASASSAAAMQIFVKTLTNKTIAHEVEPSDRVGQPRHRTVTRL